LDISQLESGKLQVVPEPTELRPLIDQVGALMRVQAQVKELSLSVSVAPDVPRWVHADATRVKQILFNLLSNAVKFSQAGTIALEVAVGAPGKIDFTVRDPGIGMDTATLERLFQRFMQGDASASRRQGGTGLGLQISRDLARLMDGDITVQSTPGLGSRFTASLALASVPAPAPTATTLPHSPSGAAPHPLRVLVAEDHPVNRAYLEAVLVKLGHHATFSEDGSGAVQAAQTQDFDVVLMDLHMPGMDGFAAASAIRAMPSPRGRVPIIALTADAFHESREQARHAGMDGFLTKPAHLPQLREALERHVAGHAATDLPAPESASPGDAAFDLATVDQVRQTLSTQTFGALLAGFFDGHASASTELHRALGDGAHGELRSRAHALKGAALSLGLRSVANLAQQLQHTEVGTPVAELQRRLDALDQTIELVHDLCVQQGLLAAR
ncbi:MAG: ATP-binding protein, partial [Burkholderiaceae bacterium]